ncbi:MAG: homocitrate synthase family protein [Methanobacteriaceae archaeon]|nr:homocitrate synthase family protein [Methanobacteriaceae archaeon]
MKDSFVSIYNDKVDLKFPKDILLYDTTLRDGEQTPGVCLKQNEKLEIARKLDELKIHQIEAGFPIVSSNEKKSVKKIVDEDLDAQIICLTRANTKDIDAALDCGVDGIITFMGASDIHIKYKVNKPKDDIINMCMNAVDYAKDHGLFVAFSAEDATRTDLDFLIKLYTQAQEHKADRIHIADTTGSISPYGMEYLVSKIREKIDIQIALHCHNDFGLAVANSIAGLTAGASAISTTVNGIGERAGNASLEEIIMALKLLYNIDLGYNTEVLYELSQLVSKYTKIPTPGSKAVVGKNVFRHESGIHVDAVLEEPLTYEPYLPEMVGRKRKLILGKHSGCRAVKAKLDGLNIKIDDDKLITIVQHVKKSREAGEYITDEKFCEIIDKIGLRD